MAKQQLARVSDFFLYISLPFLHNYDVKMPNFAFSEKVTKQRRNFISFLNLDILIQIQEGSPTFDKVSG